MTHSLDASFRTRKEAMASRRRRARWRKVAAGVGLLVLLALAVGAYVTADRWSFETYEGDIEPAASAEDIPEDAAVFVPAIVDLAGDPMLISLSRDEIADKHAGDRAMSHAMT